MATPVHSLGNSVLAHARLELLDAYAGRIGIPPARVGQPLLRTLSCWGLDWAGIHGFDQLLTVPGRAPIAFRRPPRSWLLVAPGVRYGDRFTLPEPAREFLYASFTLRGPLPPLSQRPYTLVLDDDGRLPPLLRALSTHAHRGSVGDAIAAHGLLLQLLGACIAAARGEPSGEADAPWRIVTDSPAPAASELLDRVDRLVLRSLSAPPSRQQVARSLGMSESSLAHRFRAETGMSLRERARWLRVREAKARLTEPGATVKTVARLLGFRDQAYFTRVFRAITGQTPQAFQRLRLR